MERARQLREEYESALDEAERQRARYHREILKLHRSGMSLREIAEQLGISHQRVHQIVGVAEEPRRRGRSIVGGAGVALLLVMIVGGLVLRPKVASTPSALPPLERPTRVRVTCYLGRSTANSLAMALAAAKRCESDGSVVLIDPSTGDILAVVAKNGSAVVDTALAKLGQQDSPPTTG